ncbi:hypothetical protein ARMSODRAFT_480353 [Armillaria solidipes]|uniref:Uncharacterized protein n=1 Tax=Armillaria solidipes TaxID=1076256 RepID=A0A2H3BUR9_9AGAR|nr:hypothetical protein ARMSODRAFT_480353 [Armillaria solidipes]
MSIADWVAMLGIPVGPGAEYGFECLIALTILSRLMSGSGRRFTGSLRHLSRLGRSGKNDDARSLAFAPGFTCTCPPESFIAGVLVGPEFSPGSVAYLAADQMSLSKISVSQPCQWSFFCLLISLRYRFFSSIISDHHSSVRLFIHCHCALW